ncbi:MAG: hypothetical protein V1739_02040 [Candidatus Omnitrophota bacterium]
MDKEGLKTLVFIAVGTMIGAFLRGVIQSGQKLSVHIIVRTVLFILIAAAIGFFVFKKIK